MKTIYKGDSRYEKIYEQMQLLGIQDVSTPRQVKNGTIVWRLPILSDKKNTYLEYASFASGYVRNQGVDCHSNWQCNKRIPSDAYYPEYKFVDGEQVKTGKYLKWTTRTCELIPIEIDRLEYMMKYVIKNEFIKRANMLYTDFVPKWQYEQKCNECENNRRAPEVDIIIDGQRYSVI